MQNARKSSKIRTLGEHLLKVKGVKLYWKNDTRLIGSESIYEDLYKEIKAWKLASCL